MKLSSWEIRFLSVHPPIFVLENASASRGSTIIGQGIWIRPLRETSPPTSATPKHVITMIRDFLGCVVCFKQILSKTMRRPILSPEVTASPHFTRTISPELSRTSVFFGGRDPFICASTKHIIEVAKTIGVANLRKRIIFPISKFGLVDGIILKSPDDESTFVQLLLGSSEFCSDVVCGLPPKIVFVPQRVFVGQFFKHFRHQPC